MSNDRMIVYKEKSMYTNVTLHNWWYKDRNNEHLCLMEYKLMFTLGGRNVLIHMLQQNPRKWVFN